MVEMLNKAPELNHDDAHGTESQMVLFVKHCILPVAMQTQGKRGRTCRTCRTCTHTTIHTHTHTQYTIHFIFSLLSASLFSPFLSLFFPLSLSFPLFCSHLFPRRRYPLSPLFSSLSTHFNWWH